MITFVAAVISQESQTFNKHALINSLTKLLLIINIMTLVVTQKPFITHLRHACLSLFFLQTHIKSSMSEAYLPLPHQSQLHTCLFFSKSHTFLYPFQFIFFLLFPFQFTLLNKTIQFPFHDYIPLFSSPCWYTLFAHEFFPLIVLPNLFVQTRVDWCGIP